MGKKLKKIAKDFGYPHVKMEAWRQDQAVPARLGMCCAPKLSQRLGEKSWGAMVPGAMVCPPHPILPGIPDTSQPWEKALPTWEEGSQLSDSDSLEACRADPRGRRET